MKKFIGVMLFVLGFMFGVTANAQSTTPITVGASPNANCVGSGTTFYCYTVNMTVGGVSGTAIVYPQGQRGFILFRPTLEGPDFVTGLVTSTVVKATDSVGRTTQLQVNFTISSVGAGGLPQNPDPNNDGDTDVVVGTITFNISYVLGGRWHNIYYPVITGGTGAQSITQD
jgi:hypothetical protein